MRTNLKKKTIIIAIVLVLLATMATLIVLHNNPLANPKEELVKKIVKTKFCGLIKLMF